MNAGITFVRGRNRKPAATQLLEETLSKIPGLSGQCYFGYPLIAAPEGKLGIDATLISSDLGVILFDLVEGGYPGDFTSRQDDLANKIEARLKVHRELVSGRRLRVPVYAVTFAPGISNLAPYLHTGYPLATPDTLASVLDNCDWPDADPDLYLYRATLSAIETISSIRKSRTKRSVQRSDSRGAKLKRLEDSIATLDHQQNRAVIETVDGVQRIRGLAGSGKTIVLALKAAYLHSQYPDWRIAVTFNTRSLKSQFKRLINNFCVEATGEEPDTAKIRIVNAWGASGGDDRDGIYFEFCRKNNVTYYDFGQARNRFLGADHAFERACEEALATVEASKPLYDCILVDEAQDFAPSFLRLCYAMLGQEKRLVYAYDELQSLTGESLPSPEQIFGQDKRDRPLVTLGEGDRRDVILEKCYRNSRPVLVTAHALGFGIYREALDEPAKGLVQMFDYPRLWQEIGYRLKLGALAEGKRVVLHRTDETSPLFLEEHSPINDLVELIEFQDEVQQTEWLIAQIRKNLTEDELRHDDIVVIHPDPLSTRNKTGPIRKRLFDLGIPSHLAGVDTAPDVFFRPDTQSVTFTGIYRAKGNEAGMVYVIDAHTCAASSYQLATLRNRLFTAITRSKAWVRIVGYGPHMAIIRRELEHLRSREFELDFHYPTIDVLKKLRIVHRDLSPAERDRLAQRKRGLSELLHDLKAGTIHREDLDTETKEQLKALLFGDDEE